MRIACVAASLLMGLNGGAQATGAAPFDETPYLSPQRLVPIPPDNRRLNLFCIGQGAPVVVFDRGWGSPATSFALVQPAIGRITTSCTYDRAGQGFSDPGPLPRDTRALEADVHALLHAAGLQPPYIYVAHSLAGLTAILFADLHPDELAGMVLLDPSFAHQADAYGKIPGMAAFAAAVAPTLWPCENAANTHTLPQDPWTVALCLQHDRGYGPALTAVTDQMALRPETWIAIRSEGESFDALPSPGGEDLDSEELDAAKRYLGTLDLVVLTARNGLRAPFLTPGESAAIHAALAAGHAELASRSKLGRHAEIADTGHYIQMDRPSTVIAVIRDMIMRARRRRHGGE